MSSHGIANLRMAMAQRTATATPATTSGEDSVATKYPAGTVSQEREGLKLGLRIPGGIAAVGGAALLLSSLIGRGGGTRMLAAPMLVGGGLAAAGAGALIGSSLLGPKQVTAVATKIPTRAEAQQVAATLTGRVTTVVQDVGDGSFAVIDEGPARTGGGSGSYQRGEGHYYGDGHYHGHHYNGDGHSHDPGYHEPYYPGTGDYYPNPYPDTGDYDPYPYPGTGGTSSGDDYSPGYPDNSGGDTSSGDDYGGGYDPPSYDPPSYDPPAYDPPSYDPPSHDSGGNSSSNGNPSYDDF